MPILCDRVRPGLAAPARGGGTPMHDLLLNRTLRLTVVGTIAVLGFTCLILSYQALSDSIGGSVAAAVAKLGWGLAAGAAGLGLIRYRNDLIDT